METTKTTTETETETEPMAAYRRALDGVEAMLAAVPAERWAAPSACTDWTIRDVAGHLVWGQLQLRAWAIGEPPVTAAGAPGSPHPGALTGDDPVATWRAARTESSTSLTPEALGRTTTIVGLGEVPLPAVLTLLTTDLVVHTWDIGHGLGADVRLEPDLVTSAFEWGRAHVVRRPGFFGPELTAPVDADEQTRMLAYLGRAPWVPVG
jgi:uncharacterized protein (TIGR03086 family)